MPASFAAEGGAGGRAVPFVLAALLVDHPRGRVLIDAGLAAPRALRRLPLLRRLAAALPSVPRLLAQAGFGPEEVTDVVLTHMHFDHIGAVPAFSRARVLVGPGEVAASRRPLAGLVAYAGAAAARAHGLAEVALHTWDDGGDDFPLAHDLFGDGSVVLLPTPGHTPGSLSVLLRTDPPLLHMGDAAYTLDTVEAGGSNGRLLGRQIDADPTLARRSLDRIGGLAARLGARLLPAHDPNAWADLY